MAAYAADGGPRARGGWGFAGAAAHLGAHDHALAEGFGARGDDEVLLEGELVARVRATVDHVEARHRHDQLLVAGQVGEVAVERNALGGRAGLGRGEGDAEDGVRAKGGLVRRAVHLVHQVVDGCLVGRVHAQDLGSDLVVHVGDGAEDTLAHVPITLVAQLDGLIRARRRTAGHRRAVKLAARHDVDLDRGIATRVEDLASLDGVDSGHLRVHDATRAVHDRGALRQGRRASVAMCGGEDRDHSRLDAALRRSLDRVDDKAPIWGDLRQVATRRGPSRRSGRLSVG